jgi:hypothetical protein
MSPGSEDYKLPPPQGLLETSSAGFLDAQGQAPQAPESLCWGSNLIEF